jgi:hypothetical protein
MLSQALTWLCEPPQGNFTLAWVPRRGRETRRLDDQALQLKFADLHALLRTQRYP